MRENPERRHSQRSRPEQLVYVELETNNGGMMLNVSEQGFHFRAVSPVPQNGNIRFAFAIDGTRRLEGTGELEWAEENGRVGGFLGQTDDAVPVVYHVRESPPDARSV